MEPRIYKDLNDIQKQLNTYGKYYPLKNSIITKNGIKIEVDIFPINGGYSFSVHDPDNGFYMPDKNNKLETITLEELNKIKSVGKK
ncbi:MAG: hypothetical protein PHE43_02210 [Candidatus Nanoarchaeia archaeon]|nr:hypothetical protein [Candidatus Nanoarchaeia archaeon]